MELTTEALAARLGLKAASLRHHVCRTGSYFGVQPTKLANGRLLWPADTIERLVVGTKGKAKGREEQTAPAEQA